MSERHPIIAITGSSGAGTTSVTRTFDNIFRREGVTAAVIEGDSFHRYDRKEMKLRQAEAEQAGGRASTGRQPMLGVKPSALHQRIGLVFGSKNEVERIERYHHDPATRDPGTPLFAERSLFRD